MARQEGTAPDGKGAINEVKVTAEGRALGRDIAESDQGHAIEEGEGFSLHSSYNLTGAEEAISLQNDGGDVHIPRIVVSTAATGVVSVRRMTSGTPAGTPITAKSLKFGDAVASDLTAFGNASVTGSVDGDIIDQQDIGTTDPYVFDLDNCIITKGEVIFVRFDVSGIVHVGIYFHRED